MTLLPRIIVLAAFGGFTAVQANADDLAASTPTAARTPAKMKAVKSTARNADGLGAVKFSNPYGPPEGTAQPKGQDFPTAARPTPTQPKGDMSFTYKWRATNEPIDPYDAIRHSSGPQGPGDTFMGGLKFGF